jgi:hypothetical protein
MAKKVYVTDAQAEAARLIVARDAARGRKTPPAIRKIAEATLQPARERARNAVAD